MTSIRIFSSARNRNLGGKGQGFLVVDEMRCIVESGANMLYGKGGKAFHDIVNALAILKDFQNFRNENAGPFKAGFAVANFGVGDNQVSHTPNVSIAKRLYQGVESALLANYSRIFFERIFRFLSNS